MTFDFVANELESKRKIWRLLFHPLEFVCKAQIRLRHNELNNLFCIQCRRFFLSMHSYRQRYIDMKKAFSESLNVLLHCALLFFCKANKSHSMGLFYTKIWSIKLQSLSALPFFVLVTDSFKRLHCFCVALAGSLKSRILSRVTQTKSCTQKISETIWRPTKACGIKIARAEKVAQFGRFKVVKFISSTKLHSQLSEIMFPAFKALARKLRTEKRSRRSYFRTFLELGTRIAREKFEWRI